MFSAVIQQVLLYTRQQGSKFCCTQGRIWQRQRYSWEVRQQGCRLLQVLAGDGDDALSSVWREGGRKVFAESIADKLVQAAAEAKTEVTSRTLLHQISNLGLESCRYGMHSCAPSRIMNPSLSCLMCKL